MSERPNYTFPYIQITGFPEVLSAELRESLRELFEKKVTQSAYWIIKPQPSFADDYNNPGDHHQVQAPPHSFWDVVHAPEIEVGPDAHLVNQRILEAYYEAVSGGSREGAGLGILIAEVSIDLRVWNAWELTDALPLTRTPAIFGEESTGLTLRLEGDVVSGDKIREKATNLIANLTDEEIIAIQKRAVDNAPRVDEPKPDPEPEVFIGDAVRTALLRLTKGLPTGSKPIEWVEETLESRLLLQFGGNWIPTFEAHQYDYTTGIGSFRIHLKAIYNGETPYSNVYAYELLDANFGFEQGGREPIPITDEGVKIPPLAEVTAKIVDTITTIDLSNITHMLDVLPAVERAVIDRIGALMGDGYKVTLVDHKFNSELREGYFGVEIKDLKGRGAAYFDLADHSFKYDIAKIAPNASNV